MSFRSEQASQQRIAAGTSSSNLGLVDAFQGQATQVAQAQAKADTKEAQNLLNKYFGLKLLKPTGTAGPLTQRALARFQRAEGLDQASGDRPGVIPGQLDARTLEELRARAPLGYNAAIQRSIQPQAVDRSTAAERQRQQLIRPPERSPLSPVPMRPDQTRSTAMTLPPPYIVRSGDTIEHIAQRHGVSVADIQRYNPGLNVNDLREDDPLYLPPTKTRPAPTQLPVRDDAATRQHPGPWTDAPNRRDRLQRGMETAEVGAVQRRLAALGYGTPGETDDNKFGSGLQEQVRLFQAINGIRPTNGVVGPETWEKLASADSHMATRGAMGQYPPGSPQQIELFQRAAELIGVPREWASSAALQNILRRESNGQVGRPNYTYGARARDPAQWESVLNELRAGHISARSSATGLGQLLLRNVDKYYPNGRAGIGDPVMEAAGMMAYIRDRYRTPETAWRRYNTAHEGY